MRLRLRNVSREEISEIRKAFDVEVRYLPLDGGLQRRSIGGGGLALEAMVILQAAWPVIDQFLDELARIATIVGGTAATATFANSRKQSDARPEMIVENSGNLTERQKSSAAARAARNGMSITFKD